LGTYNGNEPYVFVSYCHADSEFVRPIIQGLQDRGFRVWYDEGIEVGIAWAKYVGERLEQCSCVLAYVTSHFDDSHNCWQELDFAMEEKKQIVAIKVDGAHKLSAGMRMRLGSIQTMPFEKYGSVEKILETLSRAAVLKPCLGKVVAPAKLVESTTVEQRKQAAALEIKKEYLRSALSGLAEQKYRTGGAVATPKSSVPAKPAEPTAEELYQQGRTFFDRKEYEKAIPLLRKAAKQTEPRAQTDLGVCYQLGWGIPINYEEATRLYRQAAEQGYARAQFYLGLCCQAGIGVQENRKEARKWYQKAADQGNVGAMNALKML
jgi:tetratricopeptide (TPR) repeat protein